MRTAGASRSAQAESCRQYGAMRSCHCHSQSPSMSGSQAPPANTGQPPPPGPPGQPLIATTVSTPSRPASRIAPRSAASCGTDVAGSGCSGLPDALSAEIRQRAPATVRRSPSRAAGSASSRASSRCGAGE